MRITLPYCKSSVSRYSNRSFYAAFVSSPYEQARAAAATRQTPRYTSTAATPERSNALKSGRTTTFARLPDDSRPPIVIINGTRYITDEAYNIPKNILATTWRRIYIKRDHPLAITRQIIEAKFPPPVFKHYSDLHPVVTTAQNFDSLGFPPDHPGRSRTDTYYINSHTLLRTHTSAHQGDFFRANASSGFLISADVYRRDAIDRSHYPVFHQMEGARMWDREQVPGGDVAAAVWRDVEALGKHGMAVDDANPACHPERNPLQSAHHSRDEVEAVAAHLKRSLELMVADVFSRAKAAAKAADPNFVDEPLKARWVEAYFPFTSPSWELEVYFDGDWLEVLGCGVTKQELCRQSGVPSQLGWAFGLGLERIAMLLFRIPDIRLFWSDDRRFLKQFTNLAESPERMRLFAPYSKYPACYKDVSFWVPQRTPAGHPLHENDVMEEVRAVAGDIAEDVRRTDTFTHPKTGVQSWCYRINYCSLERTLTNEFVNKLHAKVMQRLVDRLGIDIR